MMTPEQLVNRLTEISVDAGGKPFGRLDHLYELQRVHVESTREYRGHDALSDAFKSFFLETVESINVGLVPKIKTPLPAEHALFSTRLVLYFRSLCGAEGAAKCGYPLQAYTLLRNVFDDEILTSAALQKIATFYSIEGVDPSHSSAVFDPREAKKRRKKTELEVRDVMTGVKSGLSQKTLDELGIWDALFDYETHGGRLSMAREMSWLKGTAPLAVMPAFDERMYATFMNRFSEIAWMAHRLLPNIQPLDMPFSQAWKEKWRMLDDAFERMVASLSVQLGKGIGDALVELVKAKFPFTENSSFPQ
jgi:hypothetical protein